MTFPPRFLDDIRARLPVSERAGRGVRLARRGREHVGLCPFHNEKTPSFTVNDDKGFFHCFGCGAHGDVIGFVMRHEGLSFPEAVAALAAEAGLALPERTPEARAAERRREGLHEILEFAAGRFERALAREPTGARYFADRGVDAETAQRFRLGYAPASGRALAAALAGEGFSEDLACEAGLLRRSRGGEGPTRDFFRGRAIFPIGDAAGAVIGFGARSIDGAPPKYLNSPESPVFRKREALYNLAGARRPAREAGAVTVAEGYMDAIALVRAGVEHAVAPLGAALTEDQLRALWRLAAEPLLCLDGDRAGRAAASRAALRALPLLAPGRSLSFVFLPRGEDPDSLLARAGAAALRARLTDATPLVDVIWRDLTAGRSAATPERRAALRQTIDRRVGEIADARVRAVYARTFRERFDRAFGAPRRVFPTGRGARERRGWAAEEAAAAPDDGARRERLLLVTLLNHPALLPDLAEELAALEFGAEGMRKLQGLLVDFAAEADAPAEDALHERLDAAGALDYAGRLCDPGGWSGRLTESFARADADAQTALAGFRHLAERQRRAGLEAELRAAEAGLGESMDEKALALLARLRHQLDAADSAGTDP